MDITFVDFIEYAGTFAFAVSGIRIASEKKFDLFGAFIVGLATAVGGGTLRDIMLKQNPFWMNHSVYLWITAIALVMFLLFHKLIPKIAKTLFLFDAIGLALFTAVGFQKTLDAGFPFWVANVMGMFTGAAGGVIRDILVNDVPLIFRKDIYALACCAGGIIYSFILNCGASVVWAQIACALTVIVTRVAAVHYHWQLPTLHNDEEE